MRRLVALAAIAVLVGISALAGAASEEAALKALDAANVQVQALSAIKSPTLQNFQSAQGELSALGPFFARVGDALAGLNLGPSAQLLEVGASVQAKVSDAGKVSTVDLSVFIDRCRGLQGDLERWQSLVPDVRKALQQRLDANTQALIANQVAQTFPTPIPGTASAPGVGRPQPTPTFAPVAPVVMPSPTPMVPAASAPTMVPVPAGGVIPGGWTSQAPPSVPTFTPVPGVPTYQPTPVPIRVPVNLVVGSNNQRVWVANVRGNSVGVMDATTQRFVADIPVGTQPQAMALDEGDNNLVVANYGSSSVTIVDARNDTVLKTVGVGAGPSQVLIVHGHKAYVMCQDSRSIAVIDLSLRLLLKSITLTSRPGRMEEPSSNRQVYVTLPDEDSVAVIDPGYDDVVATIRE